MEKIYNNFNHKILGSWGTVYKGFFNDYKNHIFALKMSKESRVSDNEIIIMKKICNIILKKKMCGNMPLIYTSFECPKGKLSLLKTQYNGPCVVSLHEKADGDLRDLFAQNKFPKGLWQNALFQILAGIAALQAFGQIVNCDIKSRNYPISFGKSGRILGLSYW